jgi:hypothetical protein
MSDICVDSLEPPAATAAGVGGEAATHGATHRRVVACFADAAAVAAAAAAAAAARCTHAVVGGIQMSSFVTFVLLFLGGAEPVAACTDKTVVKIQRIYGIVFIFYNHLRLQKSV